jgi:hypothetical protein
MPAEQVLDFVMKHHPLQQLQRIIMARPTTGSDPGFLPGLRAAAGGVGARYNQSTKGLSRPWNQVFDRTMPNEFEYFHEALAQVKSDPFHSGYLPDLHVVAGVYGRSSAPDHAAQRAEQQFSWRFIAAGVNRALTTGSERRRLLQPSTRLFWPIRRCCG